MLQVSLFEHGFQTHGGKCLLSLPETCRPAHEMKFVVAGRRAGGFHLLTIKPSFAFGVGADVFWSDGMLDFDMINLSGVIYQASPEALKLSVEVVTCNSNRNKIVVIEFQKM